MTALRQIQVTNIRSKSLRVVAETFNISFEFMYAYAEIEQIAGGLYPHVIMYIVYHKHHLACHTYLDFSMLYYCTLFKVSFKYNVRQLGGLEKSTPGYVYWYDRKFACIDIKHNQ